MLTKLFTNLGFGDAQSEILKYLAENQRLTALQISRGTGIERTKVYRILDELVKKGAALQHSGDKKTYYSIGDPETFQQMREHKEHELQAVEKQWSGFLSTLKNTSKNRTTDVRYYHGKDGIKQILWNELKADGEILSFTYRSLEDIVGDSFFEKWTQESDRRGIIVKDLRTKAFDKFRKELGLKYVAHPFKGDVIRYLPEEQYKDFPIAIDIYNDTVVLYDWRNNETFAVEIENANFAKFMKMVFEDYWKKATARQNESDKNTATKG